MKVVDKRFTFMESYYLSIKKISDDPTRLKFYESIVKYGLYQQEMEFNDDLEKAYFEELKAHIDISNHQREINKKNGEKAKGIAKDSMKGNQNARRYFDESKQNKAKQSKTKLIEKNINQSNKNQSNEIQSNSYKEKLYSELPSELVNSLNDFESMRKQIKKPITDKARETILKKLHEYSNGDLDIMIEILNQSIVNCWSSVYPLQEINTNQNKNQKKGLSPTDMLKMYAGKE